MSIVRGCGLVLAAVSCFSTLTHERNALAAPSISAVSGQFSHGANVVIDGSGFDQKPQAAPLIWDNATASNIAAAGWSGGIPTTGVDMNGVPDPAGNIHYTVPSAIQGVELPHSHIQKYLVGRHSGFAGFYSGANVMMWRTFPSAQLPFTVYTSFYQRVDPAWDYGLSGDTPDNNFKMFDYSYGYEPYAATACANNWYLAYYYNSQHPTVPGAWYTDFTKVVPWIFNDDGTSATSSICSNMASCTGGCRCSLCFPDENGHSLYWDSGPSPTLAWVKTEIEVRFSRTLDGYIKVWDNGSRKVNYLGRTDGYDGTNRTVAIGGFARARGARNFRYFADIYFDTTPQRVLLCPNPTWDSRGNCEVQIPTAWESSRIQINVNQGSFSAGGAAYLFVLDRAGTPNVVPRQVTIAGTNDTTAPAAPSRLRPD